MTEYWTIAFPLPGTPARTAERAEAAGWDGLLFTDSQNFNGDCYTALAIAAAVTERLGLGTGVTNPFTRHPAVTACAISSLQVESGGRAVLGIGRGDSALANLGLPPVQVAAFERYLEQVQAYLRGEPVEQNGHAAPIRWLAEGAGPKVPVDVAATGPRVIEVAARLADRVTFALGADAGRLRRAAARAQHTREHVGGAPLEIGAYLNIAAHPEAATARAAVLGSVGTAAHFSGMSEAALAQLSPEERGVVEALTRDYELPRHGDVRGAHLNAIDEDFLARFAIVGTPAQCVDRLGALLDEVELDRVVVLSGSRGVDPSVLREVAGVVAEEVIPAVRGSRGSDGSGGSGGSHHGPASG